MNINKPNGVYSIFSKLYLVGQPIYEFNNSNTSILCYELLLRSSTNDVFPKEFFERVISSRTLNAGLVRWYTKEILRITNNSSWLITINIHPQQLYFEETFFMLREIKLYNTRILIEITEHGSVPSVFSADNQTIYNFIKRIKSMQFKVALDDVGSGMHSLTNVLSLLNIVDMIKFSMIFSNTKNDIFIEELISIWKSVSDKFNLDLVVEGIEDKKIHEYLLDKNIFLQQGFLLSKPISTHTFDVT